MGNPPLVTMSNIADLHGDGPCASVTPPKPRRPHDRRNRLFTLSLDPTSPLALQITWPARKSPRLVSTCEAGTRPLPSGSSQVSLGFLHVDAAGRGLPLVPAWSWLDDLPASGLLDAVAGTAACAGVTGAGPAALVVRQGVLEVRLAGVPVARWESAGAVTDLDQVTKPGAGVVAARFVAVVAVLGWHHVEAHGKPPAIWQGEFPRAVSVRRTGPARRAGAAARGEGPGSGVSSEVGEVGG